METYGYIRVSSRDQNEARQIDAMKNFGVAADHLYIDKQSGKDFNRPNYKRLLRKIHKEDVVVIPDIRCV